MSTIAAKKVFACGISHESHSFSKLLTRLEDFRGRDRDSFDAESFRGTRSTEGGIVEASDELGWELVFPFFAEATPNGPLTPETFETLIGQLLEGLESALPVDGIVLALHGSMYAQSFADSEGEILKRVRRKIGKGVPIALSLDLHANVSDAMIDHANILTSFRTTPHTDHYETSYRACVLLDQAMRGESHPRLYIGRLPMLAGMDMGRTIAPDGPMTMLQARARTLEKSEPGVLDVALNAGFYYGDIAEAGPSVVITGDGESDRYQDIADRLIEQAWESRDFVSVHHIGVREAVIRAANGAGGPGPVILVDYTDGPAGGGYGDGTNLLAALVDADLEGTVVGPIADPQAASQAIEAGQGARITLSIGGNIDPEYGGGPLELEVSVEGGCDGRYVRKGPFSTGTVGEFGPTALVRHKNCQILLVSNRLQPEDREQFRIVGIQPENVNILALKGINHFRADFEPIAKSLIFVDSGGLVAVDFARFPFKRLRRPIWPLDPVDMPSKPLAS